MTAPPGARLILPLRQIDTTGQVPHRARVLDLDAAAPGTASGWHAAVLASAETCVLLDAEARVLAASSSAASVLGAGAAASVGTRLVDLVTALDFTSGAAPDLELERALPPLRALATGGLARGLLRLRVDGTLVTYDVVAVPLAGSSGVLAFFMAV